MATKKQKKKNNPPLSTNPTREGQSIFPNEATKQLHILVSGSEARKLDDPGTMEYSLGWDDVTRIERLIAQGADVRARDTEGWSPLDYVVDGDCVSDSEPCVSIRDLDENSQPIPIASELVRILIAAGAEVNEANPRTGQTPLMLAASRGALTLVDVLLEKGAQLEARSPSGTNALMETACEASTIDMIAALVERGADINALDREGKSALIYAIEAGEERNVERLLKCGIDPAPKLSVALLPLCLILPAVSRDAMGLRVSLKMGRNYLETRIGRERTPLLWAAICGFAEGVQILLEHGAKVDVAQKWGGSPLTCAAQRGHWDVVRVLLEHGGSNYTDKTIAMNYALEAKQIEIAARLFQAGVPLREKDGGPSAYLVAISGDAALLRKKQRAEEYIKLWYAASTGDQELFEELLSERERSRESQKSPREEFWFNEEIAEGLWYAAYHGRFKMVALLLAHGVYVDMVASSGFSYLSPPAAKPTALVAAAQGGHADIVRLLLNAGAFIGARDYRAGTALIRAAEGGHEEVARLLLEAGADVDARDENDWTAERWAKENGHFSVQQHIQTFSGPAAAH